MFVGIPLARQFQREVRAHHLVRIRKLPMEITPIIVVTSPCARGWLGGARGGGALSNNKLGSYCRQTNGRKQYSKQR